MQSIFVLLSQIMQQHDPTLRYRQNSADSAAIMKVCPCESLPAAPDQTALYLMNHFPLPEELPSKANLLCVTAQTPPSWILASPNLNIIASSHPFTVQDVSEILQEAYSIQQKFSRALAEITDALYYGKGLQAIVDIGAALIGNPIFILDTSFKALAICKSVPVKNPAIRRDNERGYLDEQALKFMQNRAWFDSLQRNGNILFFPIDEYKDYIGEESVHEWCYCYVKVNGVVAAYINIFGENTPLLEYHKVWISKLAQLVAIELQKDPRFLNGRGAMYEALLTDLLNGRITDKMVVLRRLNLLNRELKENLRVVTVRKLSAETNSFTPIEQDRIRDFFPGSSSVSFRGDVVLLVSSEDALLHTKDGETLTNRTFTLNGLVAGVSNAFTDVTEMRRFYIQSAKALEYGLHIFSSGKLFYYSDYTVFHALEQCTEKIDLRDLCHPGILKLRESSNPSDRELYQTLYLYLLYMKDVNRVAAEMHVHKGTLYYRLKKLQSELGVDLDSGNDVFQLMFSYKLEEYIDIFEPANSPLPPRPSTPEELAPPQRGNE